MFQFTCILLVIQFYFIQLLYSASSTLLVYNYAILSFTLNFNNFILFAELYSRFFFVFFFQLVYVIKLFYSIGSTYLSSVLTFFY